MPGSTVSRFRPPRPASGKAWPAGSRGVDFCPATGASRPRRWRGNTLHDDRRLTEIRLDRFLRDRIVPAVYPRSIPLALSSWDVPDEPVPALEAMQHEFTPQEHGAAWGRPWSTRWLRLQGHVP